jgi:GNAT superfamily N-acetyltransferase/RimJ/RimL family protein N-acetyltransferase
VARAGTVRLAGGVDVERFFPASDGASVRACHEIYLSGLPIDDPNSPVMSFRPFAGWMACGWTEDPAEAWLARDDAGKPCGWYRLSLPQRENRHLADLDLKVQASSRRAGLGTTLIRRAAERARDHGRTDLAGSARAGSPGIAFAHAFGARTGMVDVTRVLELAAIAPGHLATLRARAEPAARGYRLLSWTGPVPNEQVDDVTAIYNSAEADMPRDPGHEPQLWDTRRARMAERRRAAQGLRIYTVAAKSQAAGELAGLTMLAVDPAEPEWGLQDLTAVARPHRGHRLGLLVKVAMLELLADREPQLTRIITGNADANEHMIAINNDLGFSVLDEWPCFEIGIAQVLADPAPAAFQ